MNEIFEKKITIINIWKRIIFFSDEIRKNLYQYLFFIIINKFFSLGTTYFIYSAIKKIHQIDFAIKIVLFYFIFKILDWLFFIIQDIVGLKTRGKSIALIENKIFEKALYLPKNLHKGMSVVDLMKKIDIRDSLRNFLGFSINHFMMLMIETCMAAIILINLGGTILYYILWILLITIIILLFLGKYTIYQTEKENKINPLDEIIKKENNLISTTNDLFSNIHLVKIYNTENLFIQLRKDFSNKERILIEKYRNKKIKFSFMNYWICAISYSIIFIINYYNFKNNQINSATFSSIMILLTGIFWKLQQMNYIFEELGINYHLLSPGFNLLEIKNEQKKEKKEFTNQQQKIFEIKGLYFDYNGKKILKNIHIKIKNNETLFLVGASGAGKTTLINLILGEEDYQNGQILWNNESIHDYKNIIAWIPQEGIIKNGNIDFNLSIGNDKATLEEKLEALKKAKIYQKVIESGGIEKNLEINHFSGGEMQRLSIARAFLSNRPFFIFDEPTSALDIQLEKEIFKEISKFENKIKMIITHRILAIPENAKVAVLHQGEIAECGLMKDLMKEGKIFKKLYEDAYNE
jgi:ABC-type multidrug transport system fused ATPase/permease subunit